LKDSGGNYTKQAVGFAIKYNLKPEDLVITGTHLYAKTTVKGKKADKILAEIFPQVIQGLNFPKTMVWEKTNFRFARPIRNILAMYGNKNIPFKIAEVKSSNETLGLLALGAKPIKIKSADIYEQTLQDKAVIINPKKRKEKLLAQLNDAAKKSNCKVLANEDLINQTVYLAENPIAVLCKFNEEFLKLPPRLITTVFAHHMKCFAVTAGRTNLAPYFIAILDGVTKNHAQIKKGYQNVAKARLEDAKFFYEKDLKTGIEKMQSALQNVLFNEQIGSMLAKTNRIKRLSNLICESITDKDIDTDIVNKTAEYCYGDLTSQLVSEFPELQGYMGSIYAQAAGFDDKIVKALEEFYYPLTTDSILGFVPTGSEDPHGLRRQSMGIVHIMMENNIRLSQTAGQSFPFILGHAFKILQENYKDFDDAKALYQLTDFIWQRFENLYQKEFKFDEFKALKFKVVDMLNFNISFTEIYNRLQSLHNARKDLEFADLAVSFKRVSNILKDQKPPDIVNTEIFQTEFEKNLYGQLQQTDIKVKEFLAAQKFEESFKILLELKKPIDDFFDNVMVMVEEEKLKQNRLALLHKLEQLFTAAADISQLQ
jgi:glycyl-tRNA synthetase beta chain